MREIENLPLICLWLHYILVVHDEVGRYFFRRNVFPGMVLVCFDHLWDHIVWTAKTCTD